MALILVPYNEAMRLGMGFNTFTQGLCIDGAITTERIDTSVVSKDDKTAVKSPSQTVTYSSRVVDKLSDIVETLNISYSAAIKRGTIEVSGSSSTIDEDKIKSSDINAVVSVKVQNQMALMSETSKFHYIDGIKPESQAFNEVYGNGYISGFIEGGEFTGVISVRVLERKKASIDLVTTSLKRCLGKNTTRPRIETFTLDSFDIDEFDINAASTAVKDSETTVSVSWSGGGQVKKSETSWDVSAMLKAAAEFPNNVATCPQRTWAIVTKYTSNKAYVEWATKLQLPFTPLEYDNISGFSAELFDNYFQYKQLVKLLQAIIVRPAEWQERTVDGSQKAGSDYKSPPASFPSKRPPIPMDLPTLVAVRGALRNEMNKIVEAIDVLTKDPGILKRQRSNLGEPRHPFVKAFLQSARGIADNAPEHTKAALLMNLVSPDIEPQSNNSTTDTSLGNKAGTDSNEASKILVNTATSSNPGRSTTTKPGGDESKPDLNSHVPSGPEHKLYFDFDSLIAPEVWMEVMPVRKSIPPSDKSEISSPESTNQPKEVQIPAPPSAEEEKQMLEDADQENGGGKDQDKASAEKFRNEPEENSLSLSDAKKQIEQLNIVASEWKKRYAFLQDRDAMETIPQSQMWNIRDFNPKTLGTYQEPIPVAIPFSNPYAVEPPQIIAGLAAFDIAYGQPVTLSTRVSSVSTISVNLSMNSQGPAKSARVSWMALPRNNLHIQSGVFDADKCKRIPGGDAETERIQNRIMFPKPFTKVPKVAVWLMSVDFPPNQRCVLDVRSENETTTYFDLIADTRKALPFKNFTAGWMAVDGTGSQSKFLIYGSLQNCPTFENPIAFQNLSGWPQIFVALSNITMPVTGDGLSISVDIASRSSAGPVIVSGSNKRLDEGYLKYCVIAFA